MYIISGYAEKIQPASVILAMKAIKNIFKTKQNKKKPAGSSN